MISDNLDVFKTAGFGCHRRRLVGSLREQGWPQAWIQDNPVSAVVSELHQLRG